MSRMKIARFLCFALVVVGIVWAVLFVLNPAGIESKVFYENGSDLFGDFRWTHMCGDYGYVNDHQPPYTACYPAIGPLLVHMFPIEAGGWFTGIGIAIWSGAFIAFVGRRGWLLPLLAVLTSSVMLHALERGNPIVVAAAGCMLFLAWFADENPWKRQVAGFALAVAVALKLSPAVLVLLYAVRLRADRERWHEVVSDVLAFAGMSALLFAVPFVWCGGWDGFCQWCSNAELNVEYYARASAWGVLAVGRTVRAALHVDVMHPWPWMGLERGMDAVLGLVCLVVAGWRIWRQKWENGNVVLLVMAGLLLVPGSMLFYTGLYLIPVFVLRLREGMGWAEAVCWFLMFCPLQIPIGTGCLNHPLANLAFLMLVVRALKV